MHVNEKVFEGLNPDQQKAVNHIFGPCCVIAGPGSGKSHCVVRKVAHAINNGVEPSSIIIFTFTNKAAKEIRERVTAYVGEKANYMIIGTYHSVCVKILRQYIHYLGYNKSFTILDTEDTEKIISDLCKGTTLNTRGIMSYISTQKRNMIDYQAAIRDGIGINAKRAEIYRDYELRLRAQNCLDFDNLILMTVKLLNEHKDVQEKLHKKYNYIVADESQDSSPVDLEFIGLLSNANHNLTMVGDFDQSIYSFRGTSVEKVIEFINGLEGAQTIILNQNYRSSQTIVKASRSLIDKNPKLDNKQLFSENDIGDKIIYAEDQSPQTEANRVVDFIKHMRSASYDVPYKEMMVLYRTNTQSFEIEKALLKHSIPYQLIGRINFYARKEIKDLMAYLRLAYNPYDYEAFKRAINVPKRGLGAASIQKLYDYACANNLDLLTCLAYAKEAGLAKKAIIGTMQFAETVNTLRNAYLFMPPSQALDYLITDIDYLSVLETDEEEKASRIDNVQQLQEISYSFSSLEEMLEQSSLQDADKTEDQNKVRLMSMHASKGLEADCVFIMGCNEELIPFVKAIEAGNVEEERRLYYVAMTRARKYLFMTRSRSMLYNGRFKSMKESRFIKEIASEFIFKMPCKAK